MNRLVLLIVLMASPFTAVGKPSSLPIFADVTRQAGINVKHSYGDFELSNIVEGTGVGGMFFDYDGDGWLDIYLPNGCWLKHVNDNRGRKLRGKLTNRLFRNNGDGTFSDVTQKARVGDTGYGTGCSAADYDNDGDQDLYILNYGANVLYRNNGNGTFTDVSSRSRLGDPRWSLSAPWFDYDGDGDLDVYVANYLEYDSGKFRSFYAAAGYPGPLSYSGQPDALYRNNGDGTFTDVTQEADMSEPEGRAMSATVADLDNNGTLDIYVANDAMENYFFRNTGKGTFESEGLMMGMAFGEGGQGVSSMGPAVGDVDRDGLLDVYIPDMRYGCLLMNKKDYFEDRTAQSNLAIICGQYTGWGGTLFDYDCDGYLDVFVSNGNAHHEYTEEDVLLRNDGQGKFVDVAKVSGAYFQEKFVGRGSTYGDYDNDGDLDLLVINLNKTPKLLRNDGGNRNHWLMVDARLSGGQRDAIGARVTVRSGSLVQIQDVIPVTGYLSQADTRRHFGLGEAEVVEAVEIRWPDGQVTRLSHVKANQMLKVTQESQSTE
ncbi:MAG: CRTAC1 family protein [Planctomycetes bacterium]|nr:CRTAC1 family protein [Planctomycetota bacterium]